MTVVLVDWHSDDGAPRLFWMYTLSARVESDRIERPSRCSLHTSQFP
jgi:hypothetical protein